MNSRGSPTLLREMRLFGTGNQTRLLVLIGVLEETYASELARLAGVNLATVQNFVKNLELGGVLATRVIGKERRIGINRRFPARNELKALLAKLAELDPVVQDGVRRLRKRPRRMGKDIDPDVPDELRR